MRALPTALLAVLALAPMISAWAQGTIRGVVFDSLRSGKPVAGAEVVLFGTARRDTTDSRGRFEFKGVSAGEQRVGYWAPWLDSLAVPALEARLAVAGGDASVTLATPSRRTAQRALCGAELDDDATVILGEVRDRSRQALAGAPVYGWWHETLLGKQRLEQRTMATADTTDAAGMYVLCGIPRGARLEMHADGPDSALASIAIAARGGIVRQDLTVGSATASMLVTGRVVGSKQEPIAGVLVSPPRDTTGAVQTSEDGRFAIRMPAHSAHLWFRAVGYGPVERLVDPSADPEATVTLGDVALQTVRELGAVSVVADGVTRERLEFEERRKFNFQGTFFDDEELAKLTIVTPGYIASRVPRSSKQGLTLERNGGWCVPRLFVDGGDYGLLNKHDAEYWLQLAKRVEVYRAAWAPPRFADFNGCGSVVIWTR